MKFLELVERRKSCRTYSTKSVERDKIDRCLEAARLAPSACNSQPWSFIVVADPTKRTRLAEKAFSGIFTMNAFAKQAPILVVVITEKSKYAAIMGGKLRGTQYSLIDIGIACEHFILQAEEEGLASCWIGLFDEAAVKKVLGISKDKKIDIIISLGYAPGQKPVVKQRNPIAEISEYR